MHSRRRFGSTLTALAFLTVVSVLAVISIEEVFKIFASTEDRLSPRASTLKRNRGRSARISFPWNGPGDAENLKGADSSAITITLTPSPTTSLVTVTVCSSEDYKSAVSLVASTPKPSAATFAPEKGLTDGSKQSVSSLLIGLSPTIAGVPVSCVPIPAFATGYFCQPIPQTTEPYPEYCAPYVSNTYTVTQTFHSTDYSYIISQISYPTSSTVAVTVFVTSTSSLLIASNTLLTSLPSLGTLLAGSALTSSLPTSFLPSNNVVPSSGASSSLVTTGATSRPIIVCSNGSAVEHEQDCLHPVTTSPTGSSLSLAVPLTATLPSLSTTISSSSTSRSAPFAASQKSQDSAVDVGPTKQASISGSGATNGAPGGANFPGSSTAITQAPFRSASPSTFIDAATAVNTVVAGGVPSSSAPNAVGNSKSATISGLSNAGSVSTPPTSVYVNASSTVGAVLPSGESVASLSPSAAFSTRLSTIVSSLVVPSAQGPGSSAVSDLRSVASSSVALVTSVRGAAPSNIGDSNSIIGLGQGAVASTPGLISSVISSTGPSVDDLLPTGIAIPGQINSVPSIAGSKVDILQPATNSAKLPPSSPVSGTLSSKTIASGPATIPLTGIPDVLSVATSATGVVPSSTLVPNVANTVSSDASGVIAAASAIQSLAPTFASQGLGVVSTAAGARPVASTIAPISQNVSAILAAVGILAGDVSAVSSVAAGLPVAVSIIEDAVPAISSVAANLPGVVSTISKFIAELPVVGNILKDANPSATSLSGQLASLAPFTNRTSNRTTVEAGTTNARVVTQVISTVTIFVPKSEIQTKR